jgi:hypothetical protein
MYMCGVCLFASEVLQQRNRLKDKYTSEVLVDKQQTTEGSPLQLIHNGAPSRCCVISALQMAAQKPGDRGGHTTAFLHSRSALGPSQPPFQGYCGILPVCEAAGA